MAWHWIDLAIPGAALVGVWLIARAGMRLPSRKDRKKPPEDK